MFNYVKVKFPESPSVQPSFVYSATLKQNRYSHEIMTITFRDWDLPYEVVEPNSPVNVTMYGPGKRREFYGYVHHIAPEQTPGKNFVTVVLIGASFLMKRQSQKIYKNATADRVVREIAKKHNFVCYSVPHPRVFPQISQTGHSDWELMVRLAKQCGYTLRATNTELYFQPILEDYTKYRAEAPRFVKKPTSSLDGTTIYSFNPVIGETIEFDDARKAAVAVSGVDVLTASQVSYTKQKANKKTRKKKKSEILDQFDTVSVAPSLDVAKYEAEAAEARNAFPYRAKVEVIGDPTLRPDFPVYLDGLGQTYSGFWTVLSTEHVIVEEELNRHRYTTILEVGTDSLGKADRWTDSKEILSPDYLPQRTLIPNVKQTKVAPKTQLKKTGRRPTPQTETSFGSVKNRSRTASVSAPTWKSATPTLSAVIPQATKSSAVINRLSRISR